MADPINWVVLLIPVPIVAILVCHHAHKTGRSRKACLLWTLGSILLFPLVPITYLITRKNIDSQDLPDDDTLDYGKH